METADSLHDFWFGGAADESAAQRQATLWWGKSAEVDAEVARRFGALVEEARNGALDAWRLTPQGALALILLTDQLPRNIYRGTPAAFASDSIAHDICVAGLGSGFDQLLTPVERVFFYLPLEHAESLAAQDRSVAQYTALLEQLPESARETFHGFLDYAKRHRVVIEQFGRFPHRNAILGRVSTVEEVEFLKKPGSSF